MFIKGSSGKTGHLKIIRDLTQNIRRQIYNHKMSDCEGAAGLVSCQCILSAKEKLIVARVGVRAPENLSLCSRQCGCGGLTATNNGI